MTEKPSLLENSSASLASGQDTYERFTVDQLSNFVAALEAGQDSVVREMLKPLRPQDIASIIEQLTREERKWLLEILPKPLDADILSYLAVPVREEILPLLDPEALADVVRRLESDDAIDLLEDLTEEQKQDILQKVAPQARRILEQGLNYPEESAGRLMQRELVSIPVSWTVGETIDFLRAKEDLPKDFYDFFLVDAQNKPIGVVPLSRAMRNKRVVNLADIMDKDFNLIPVHLDRREVALIFRKYGLVSAPVIDEQGKLVGVITVDDVVNVIDAEAAEDLLKMGGLRASEFHRSIKQTTLSRWIWLAINLFTSILASLIIDRFSSTIERQVALAVLMPLIASMGMNAGTQTITVAVRALAVHDLNPGNRWRFLIKEMIVSVINGSGFAVIAVLLAWGWFGDVLIGAIFAAAMFSTLLIAAIVGAAIPIFLDRYRIDPADSSVVLVTTVTDIVAFASFLGLAYWIL